VNAGDFQDPHRKQYQATSPDQGKSIVHQSTTIHGFKSSASGAALARHQASFEDVLGMLK
jgi:hypothetical protein